VVYLDSSAIVKLVQHEAESAALRHFLRDRVVKVSCALARTEVLRAVAAGGPEVRERAHRVVVSLDLIALDDALLDAAGDLPGEVRSLDAIHVAAAQALGQDLECLVTYDRRMATAAAVVGMRIADPA